MIKDKLNFGKNKIMIITAIIVIVIAVVVVLLLCSRNTGSGKNTSEGVEFIKSMEGQNVADVENEIFSMAKQAFLDEVDEKLAEDPDYVWTALSQINTVIMGDSRAVAFSSYGFMDDTRVLADGGQSLKIITSHFEELPVVNPRLVVLAYGLNDINWYWFTPEDFAEEMMEYVDEIQAMLPDAYIYIQSILPANETGNQVYPDIYPLAREWNEKEMQIYKDRGYRVLEISWLVDEYPEYYGEDGVHFMPGFYYHWATEILKKYLSDTMEIND